MPDPQQSQQAPDAPQFGGDNALADKIRAKFPGSYDDMSDAQLAASVVKKYPQYTDLSLPYDMKVKRNGQWVAVRSETATPDERTHGVEYHPPDVYSAKNTYEGAKTGLMVATLPLAFEATIPQLIGGAAGGVVGSTAASAGARKLGAGDTGQEIAGDVGGVVGGGVGGGIADWTAGKVTALYDSLPEGIQQVLKRHALGMVSPRAKNAADLVSAIRDASATQEPPFKNPGAPLPLNSPESRLPAAFQPPPAKAPAVPGTADTPFRGPSSPVPVRQAPELPAAFQPLPARPAALPGTADAPFQAPARPTPGTAGSVVDSIAAPEASGTLKPMNPAASASIPRTLSGESALRQVLGGQDNANLLKIARSRGINVSQEAQLKPGVADSKLINKIIDDFSDGELDNLRSTYIESTRLGPQDFKSKIGAEANKTLSLQTYFPDVKVPSATLRRTASAMTTAKTTPDAPNTVDLMGLMKKSIAQIEQRKTAQQ